MHPPAASPVRELSKLKLGALGRLQPSGGGTDVTNLLMFAQRSLLKFGGDIASLFLPSAVDEGAVRPTAIPIAIQGSASSSVAIRWMSCESFRRETKARHPANDNRLLAKSRGVPRWSSDRVVESRLPVEAALSVVGNVGPRRIRHPGNKAVGPILVDDAIGPSVSSFDGSESALEVSRRRFARRPKQASIPAMDEIVSDETATLTQEGA
jgi:hypothetical protein